MTSYELRMTTRFIPERKNSKVELKISPAEPTNCYDFGDKFICINDASLFHLRSRNLYQLLTETQTEHIAIKFAKFYEIQVRFFAQQFDIPNQR